MFWFRFLSHSVRADGSQHWSSPDVQILSPCKLAGCHLIDLSLTFPGFPTPIWLSILAYWSSFCFSNSVTILPWTVLLFVLKSLSHATQIYLPTQIETSCIHNFESGKVVSRAVPTDQFFLRHDQSKTFDPLKRLWSFLQGDTHPSLRLSFGSGLTFF